METETRNLRKEISEKLKDETLRDALGRFSEAYPIARTKAYENAGDIETLRDTLRQMKIDTVARIGEVADRFEAEAMKRGAKVFRARRPETTSRNISSTSARKRASSGSSNRNRWRARRSI